MEITLVLRQFALDLTEGFRSASPTVANLPYELSVDNTKFAEAATPGVGGWVGDFAYERVEMLVGNFELNN